MLDRIATDKQISNLPLTDETTPNDCDFELEIRSDHRRPHPHVSIVIKYPSSTDAELTHQSFGVGDVDKDGIVEFNPSFGTASDAPLDENQKQIIQELVTKALSKKGKNN